MIPLLLVRWSAQTAMNDLPDEVLQGLFGWLFATPVGCQQAVPVRRVCRRWERVACHGRTWCTDWTRLCGSSGTGTASSWMLRIPAALPCGETTTTAVMQKKKTTLRELCVRIHRPVDHHHHPTTHNNDQLSLPQWFLHQVLLLGEDGDGEGLLPHSLQRVHIQLEGALSPTQQEQWVRDFVGPLLRMALAADVPDVVLDLCSHPSSTMRHHSSVVDRFLCMDLPSAARRIGWTYCYEPLTNVLGMNRSTRALLADLRTAFHTQPHHWDCWMLPVSDLMTFANQNHTTDATLLDLVVVFPHPPPADEDGGAGGDERWEQAVRRLAPRRWLAVDADRHHSMRQPGLGTLRSLLTDPLIARIPQWEVVSHIVSARDVEALEAIVRARAMATTRRRDGIYDWRLLLQVDQTQTPPPPSPSNHDDAPRCSLLQTTWPEKVVVTDHVAATTTSWGAWFAGALRPDVVRMTVMVADPRRLLRHADFSCTKRLELVIQPTDAATTRRWLQPFPLLESLRLELWGPAAASTFSPCLTPLTRLRRFEADVVFRQSMDRTQWSDWLLNVRRALARDAPSCLTEVALPT